MKHIVQQSDRHRAILTDLIPYEVPLRFSFLHIHSLLALRDPTTMSPWIDKLLAHQPQACVPYCYWIRTGEGRKRRLGLIHPLLLGDAATLYADFGDLIISLCNKSSWSLRRPARIAKMYYPSEERRDSNAQESANAADLDPGSQGVGLIAEEEDQFQDHASSFFAYRPYNLLQKFFASSDLLGLERRFSKCRRIDIAKCFGSIYSHSISWAIKGKAGAKKEKSCQHTFDGRLDSIMQRSNHGETHGILIGAEFSRIFAEIIFQEIDARTREQLAQPTPGDESQPEWRNGIVDGRDYTVRRYIDDYFIYANEDHVLNHVQEALESHLDKYKLFPNEKKTTDLRRPFITGISATKDEVRRYITDHLDFTPSDLAEPQTPTGPSRRRYFVSSKIINGLRLILGEIDVEYPDVSSFVLKHIQNLVKKKLGLFHSAEHTKQYAGEWIRCVLEVAFYLFSVDIRFRTSILVSRMITDLTEACSWLPPLAVQETENSIMRESISVLRQVHQLEDPNRLEIASFLVALRGVREFWRIPESLITSLCSSRQGEPHKPDYFTIVAVSYFASDRGEYRALQSKTIDAARRRISGSENLLEDTELFCLSLDMLSCPWADNKLKELIASKFIKQLKQPTPTRDDIRQFVNEFSQQIWFFDWRSAVANHVYLQKKELSLSY